MLYGPFAWAYDWVAATVSCGYWQRWVVAILPYLPGPKVLELGFGPGHLQAALNQSGIYSVGLDASWRMNSLARRTLLAGKYPLHLLNGYAQSLPLPDQSFEQVVATFPAPFIFESHTLSEIQRVLTPGGRLVVLLSAAVRGHNPCQLLAAWLCRRTSRVEHSAEQRLQERFQAAGLDFSARWMPAPGAELWIIVSEKSDK